MIKTRVSKWQQHKDSVMYTAECACGSHEHNAVIEIEKEKDGDIIYLNFYKTIAWSSHWGEMNWFRRIWKRIKCATKVLFTGWVELEESFVIQGEDQIEHLIEALEEGKNHIKNYEGVK